MRILKKDQVNFQKKIVKFINTLDLIEPKEYKYYKYCINTKMGIMHIDIHEDDCIKPVSQVYSIFCIFSEIEKANKNDILGINEHSGKYNFMDYNKNIFDTFKRIINMIKL